MYKAWDEWAHEGSSCEERLEAVSSLPKLPPALQKLFVGSNYLTSLPDLPISLQWLYVSDNQLTSLPVLPPSILLLKTNNNPIVGGDDCCKNENYS
jgi:Leucine-rich repeat (LRR) protein